MTEVTIIKTDFSPRPAPYSIQLFLSEQVKVMGTVTKKVPAGKTADGLYDLYTLTIEIRGD